MTRTATGATDGVPTGHRGEVRSVNFARDGKQLFSIGADRQAIEWDMVAHRNTGRLFRGTLGQDGPDYGGIKDLSPDGSILAHSPVVLLSLTPVQWEVPTIRLENTVTGKNLHTLRGHKHDLASLRFSPDGKMLASAAKDGIRLWDVSSGKERHKLSENRSMYALAFSPNGKVLASIGLDQSVYCWDAATGQELRRWETGHRKMNETITFSPDGTLIATGEFGSIRLWAAGSGTEVRGIATQMAPNALTFSPGAAFLAAGGYGDRTDSFYYDLIELWEVNSGQEIRRIEPHQGGVSSLGFAPDGRSLVSGGKNANILVWDLTVRAPNVAAHAAPLTANRLGTLWSDLRADAAKADAAIWGLTLAPRESLPFLKESLLPAAAADDKQLTTLLADLESKTFKVRQQAEKILGELGESAEAALNKSLQSRGSLESRRRIEQILEKRAPDALRNCERSTRWSKSARRMCTDPAIAGAEPRRIRAYGRQPRRR